MIKDAIIAALIGILVAGKITPPGDQAIIAAALSFAVIAFFTMLWLEDLRERYRKRIRSRIHWIGIQLKEWPTERAARGRRREMMLRYVRGLQENHQSKESPKGQKEVILHDGPGDTHSVSKISERK